MDYSDFTEFLSKRSSVREYEETPVSKGEIDYILSSASKAPSAGNLEAWDVVVVTETEQKLALTDAALGQEHVGQASILFVVCANYVRSMSKYGERGILYAVQDATIACTYMMLAAHARGLCSCWTGAFDEDEVREVLSLPAHIRPLAILAVGHGQPNLQRTRRMDTKEHVHLDVW